MAKRDRKPVDKSSIQTTQPAKTAISALRQDADLWYKIHVLLYDLSNIATDTNSEKRVSSTTHELYISKPYFTDSEATRIRTTLVDDTAVEVGTMDMQNASKPDPNPSFDKNMTVEEAIHGLLSDFFSKRKASGDARPCGPHDMVPVYGSVFGIQKDELKDERFLSRLRRSGLGDSQGKEETTSKAKDEKNGKRRK